MDFSTISLDRTDNQALYRQLADLLTEAMTRGELRAGDRLPSERELAATLAVSRTTAVNAYRDLEARGLVRGHVGRGTFVCAAPGSEANGAPFAWRGKVALGAQRTVDPILRSLAQAAGDPELIVLAAAMPALDIFPTEAFSALTDEVLRRYAAAALSLAPTEGQPRLRRAIAGRFGVRPEQILVVAGAQHGIDLIARCLLDPGDAVVMDRPGYLGAIQVFHAAGARVVGWDVERADLEELEDILLRYRPKLLYTNPTFQNPTGHVVPTAVRRDLLALAARYRLPIVEDEPYRRLGFPTAGAIPPTLYHLDDGQLVIHLGTFAKTLANGLRLGWLAAAEPIVDQIALVRQRSDLCCPSLTQLVVAECLTTGLLDAHLSTVRAEHARRHDAMLASLARHLPSGALTCRPVQGGLGLWCRLGHGIDAVSLLREATRLGVVFVPGEQFYADGSGAHELRLCFAGSPPAKLDEGARRLAAAFKAASSTRRRQDEGTRPLV